MHIMKRWGPWLAAALLSASCPAFAEITDVLEDSCEEALQLLHQKIRDNRFITDRLALDYERQTSGFLSEALLSIPVNGHWIDAGAGEAKAQLEFLGLWKAPVRTMSPNFLLRARPGFRATAVAYQPPSSNHMEWLLSQNFESQGFKYIHGSYIEDLPPGALQPADLITDMYGPLAYTTNFSEMLELYRSLLTDEGKLIFLTSEGFNKIAIGDRLVPLEDWLIENYTACGLKRHTRWDFFRQDKEFLVTSFMWNKKDMDQCELPKLRLVNIKVAGPPYRLFELVE